MSLAARTWAISLSDMAIGRRYRLRPCHVALRVELPKLLAMPDYAVEALNIVRTFSAAGEVRALDDVSLQVPTGQVFGLLGPNGSGKTTMVRILSTILSPTSGRATVAGFDVVKQPKQVRHHIGLAGQNATVDENLTGFENIRMVGLLNHLNKAYVVAKSRQLLEEFGLSDAANRITKTYSGGMRRRLDLAAALVAESADSLPRRTNHRASTPRAVRTCGQSSSAWSRAARPCCSPPSTSTRPTAWPSSSSSWTTARSSPRAPRLN